MQAPEKMREAIFENEYVRFGSSPLETGQCSSGLKLNIAANAIWRKGKRANAFQSLSGTDNGSATDFVQF